MTKYHHIMAQTILCLLLSFLTIVNVNATIFHAIMFCDTGDERIGRGVQHNVDRIDKMFYQIGQALQQEGILLKKYKYIGADCNKQNLQNLLMDLTCKDDIVFFYYAGHGGRSISDKSNFPRMCLGSNREIDFMAISDVDNILRDKKPRLRIIFTDCCNSVYNAAMPATRMATAGGSEDITSLSANSLKKLFLKYKGYIIGTGAKPSSYSWYNNGYGGFYTISFLESLNFSLNRVGETPQWAIVMNDTKDQTHQMSEICYRQRQITDIQIPYSELDIHPIVFSNPYNDNTLDINKYHEKYQKIPFSNGYYYGEVSNGKYHGRGSYFFDNGQKFEGYFTNGKINGSGIYFWNEKHFFSGTWTPDNGRNGYGIEVTEDGSYIVGYWEKERYIGKNKTPTFSNRINYYNGYYIGETSCGKPNGHGCYIWKNGSKFYGTWKNGIIDGSGLLYFNDNQGCFVGYWHNGYREATYGLQCLTNGSRLIGFWENEIYRYNSKFFTFQ